MAQDPFRASTGALDRPGPEAWDRERYDRGRNYEVRDEHYSHGALPVRAREPSVERHARPAPPQGQQRAAYPDDTSDIMSRRYVPRTRGPPVDDFYEQRYVEEDRRRVRRFSPSPPPAPRPGIRRRQSSLDTFDRLPARFYEQPPERYGPPARRADYVPPPYVPEPPRPRQLPLAAVPYRRDYMDDIRIADPDYYGDEDFRPVRDREYVHERKRSRRRHRGRSRSRSRSRESRTTTTTTTRSSSTSSRSSSSSGGTTVKSAKSEYPKKGKTRIPARLVSKRALYDLNYQFEEDGATIVVLMALGQKNIDDLLKLSEDYKKAELELEQTPVAALPAPLPAAQQATAVVINRPAPAPAPAHVVIASPRTVESISSANVIEVAPPVGPPLEIEESKRVSVVRETSPTRSYTTGYTSTSGSQYIDDFEAKEHTHIGPLILAKDGHHHRKSRSRSRSRSRSTRRGERAIAAEIRALEAERDALRHERRHRRHRSASLGGDVVRYHERLSNGDLVVYEEKVEEFDEDTRHRHRHRSHSRSHSRHRSRGPRIEKDKKGPPPALLRAMLTTLT